MTSALKHLLAWPCPLKVKSLPNIAIGKGREFYIYIKTAKERINVKQLTTYQIQQSLQQFHGWLSKTLESLNKTLVANFAFKQGLQSSVVVVETLQDEKCHAKHMLVSK